MRILHLEASPGWGGQEIRILREAEAMRSRGHEIILGVMENGALIDQACKAGFTVHPLPFKKTGWPLCLIRLLVLMRRHGIELVNTHSSLDAWIGGIAAKIARLPIVRTRHLSTPVKGGWNSRLLYGKLADFVVATCASILPMISEQSGKPKEKCRSIPTGVDPTQLVYDPVLSAQFRARFGIADADFLVGTACFMRSWKGIDDLLAAAHLLRAVPHIRWIVIGGGHAERYRRQAEELGLNGIVQFSGHLEHPFPALGALDAFALLSTAHEGVSQAILQAAYLGKPLIATAVGGLGEVCLDRLTGIQVDPFAPEQVAKAVLELKGNRKMCEELGLSGRRLVEERFTFLQTIDQMEAVYQSMIGSALQETRSV